MRSVIDAVDGNSYRSFIGSSRIQRKGYHRQDQRKGKDNREKPFHIFDSHKKLRFCNFYSIVSYGHAIYNPKFN